MVIEMLQRFFGYPNFKSHRVTIPIIMSEKKVSNQYPHSKAIGKHDKSGSVLAFGYFNIVYVTSLLFDVIGRLCQKKRQKLKS